MTALATVVKPATGTIAAIVQGVPFNRRSFIAPNGAASPTTTTPERAQSGRPLRK